MCIRDSDNTATTGILAVGDAGKGSQRTALITMGIRAVPAIGDPAFCGQFIQQEFSTTVGESVMVNLPFMGWSASGSTLLYDQSWGVLLHANGAEAGANTSGTSGVNNGASSALGGYAVFMLFSGTAITLSVQDSDDAVNANFGLLVGSGELTAPSASLIALTRTATVKQFIRWQTSAAATFAIAFVRATH